MKNLKSLIFGLAALCLAFGLMFSVSAFKKKTNVYWQYTKNNHTDIRDGYSYSQVTSPEAEACDPGNDLPCVLEVDASISSQALLDDYLRDTNIFQNDSDITDAAMFKKAD
ncbi:hypothetical protein [Pedobacter sp. ASV28]|uniref:hypothetical protein n=1 Tax=Pedobacter sp. ASV28 TaxID=2795123 RepID=UPI0018EC1CE4|nr:hypothetical protein [Pedobacter sp. ASV28]